MSAKLTDGEKDALCLLDWCCWDDSEQGGDGWVRIGAFAERYEVSYCWASQLLAALERAGFAESRRSRYGGQPKFYAPSEQGAALINSQRASLGGQGG